MSELSRRLRDAAKAYPSSIPPARHLYGKAADRIEQLEATLRVANDRIEALEKALEAMCINMKNDGQAYRDCYIHARAVLDRSAPGT